MKMPFRAKTQKNTFSKKRMVTKWRVNTQRNGLYLRGNSIFNAVWGRVRVDMFVEDTERERVHSAVSD